MLTKASGVWVNSFILLLGACAGPATAEPRGHELIVCGGDEVYVLDTRSEPPAKVWSWKAADRPELPEALRPKFRSTDECKPLPGDRILITSSGGAVAVVERATGRAVFWAAVTNAHSAELLPGGRVLVASSYGKDGNRLLLFDPAWPEKEIWWDDLYGAHGAVWDAKRQVVWTLGEKILRAYALKDLGAPVRAFELDLPDEGGHDLFPVAGTAFLTITTGAKAWLFDRERRSFAPHPDLGQAKGVKCISTHPATGRIAYVQAETSWWSERIRFLGPEGVVQRPGERLYKARWNAVTGE